MIGARGVPRAVWKGEFRSRESWKSRGVEGVEERGKVGLEAKFEKGKCSAVKMGVENDYLGKS
jgi:hypothetical protein